MHFKFCQGNNFRIADNYAKEKDGTKYDCIVHKPEKIGQLLSTAF